MSPVSPVFHTVELFNFIAKIDCSLLELNALFVLPSLKLLSLLPPVDSCQISLDASQML